MNSEFNESARTEEQRRIAHIQNDERRKALLENIRRDTENYLRSAQDLKARQRESFGQAVNQTYGELVVQQGFHMDYLPPGTTRSLTRAAFEKVHHAHGQARMALSHAYEKNVRERINQAVEADRLDRRMQSYVIDRNAWVGQHMNIVGQMEKARTDAERLHYGEVLATLDRSWARTIERYMGEPQRERGLQPEFGRVAYDVGHRR